MSSALNHPRLYVLVSRKEQAGVLAQILKAVPVGSTWIQLRAPGLPTRQFQALAASMRALTADYGAPFLINDRVDVALAVNADGVQLRHDSLSPVTVKRMWPSARIGRSCNSPQEVQVAQKEGACFAVLGPIFATPSKTEMGQVPLGLNTLFRARQSVGTSFPIVAIGGITIDDCVSIWENGASGVAAVRAILMAQSPRRSALRMLEK
jgi:thiamine-phosphate pyrophosphorylase